ncbi:hypothetical protein ACFL1B_00515 [Nanoarchaeota archaeon]
MKKFVLLALLLLVGCTPGIKVDLPADYFVSGQFASCNDVVDAIMARPPETVDMSFDRACATEGADYLYDSWQCREYEDENGAIHIMIRLTCKKQGTSGSDGTFYR